MTGRVRAALIAILAAAFALRLVQALTVAPDVTFLDDDNFYHLTANLIADGTGYVRPLDFALEGRTDPTAEHPPLYPALLAIVAWLGGTGVDVQRLVGVAVGTAVVLVVALIARRLGGDRAAIAAAAIAALHPTFVAADGSLMSEPLVGLLVALTVLQGLRAREQPRLISFAVLGALVGLATLARSETLLLLPLVLLATVPAARRNRAMLVGAAVAATAIVLAPWVVRNINVFDRPLLSTNDGTTLAGSNCPQTYGGPDLGWFVFACAAERGPRTGTEADRMARLRERGLEYARGRPGRAVVVAGVRGLTVWGLYAPRRQFVVTGRRVTVQQAGTVVYYLIAAMAIAGLLVLRRRVGWPVLLLLLAPALVATLTAMLTHGNHRFRHGAEVLLVVLAGVAVAEGYARRFRSRTTP